MLCLKMLFQLQLENKRTFWKMFQKVSSKNNNKKALLESVIFRELLIQRTLSHLRLHYFIEFPQNWVLPVTNYPYILSLLPKCAIFLSGWTVNNPRVMGSCCIIGCLLSLQFYFKYLRHGYKEVCWVVSWSPALYCNL